MKSHKTVIMFYHGERTRSGLDDISGYLEIGTMLEVLQKAMGLRQTHQREKLSNLGMRTRRADVLSTYLHLLRRRITLLMYGINNGGNGWLKEAFNLLPEQRQY